MDFRTVLCANTLTKLSCNFGLVWKFLRHTTTWTLLQYRQGTCTQWIKTIYREKQLDFKFTFAHALRTITYTAKKKPLKTNTLNSQYLGGPKTQGHNCACTKYKKITLLHWPNFHGTVQLDLPQAHYHEDTGHNSKLFVVWPIAIQSISNV